jgi:hypothetical protein
MEWMARYVIGRPGKDRGAPWEHRGTLSGSERYLRPSTDQEGMSRQGMSEGWVQGQPRDLALTLVLSFWPLHSH